MKKQSKHWLRCVRLCVCVMLRLFALICCNAFGVGALSVTVRQSVCRLFFVKASFEQEIYCSKTMAHVLIAIFNARRRNARIMREFVRDNTNPFAISETLWVLTKKTQAQNGTLILIIIKRLHRFIRNYRLPQRLARNLIEEIRPIAGNIGEIPLEFQLLSVLNFYASGSYQL